MKTSWFFGQLRWFLRVSGCAWQSWRRSTATPNPWTTWGRPVSLSQRGNDGPGLGLQCGTFKGFIFYIWYIYIYDIYIYDIYIYDIYIYIWYIYIYDIYIYIWYIYIYIYIYDIYMIYIYIWYIYIYIWYIYIYMIYIWYIYMIYIYIYDIYIWYMYTVIGTSSGWIWWWPHVVTSVDWGNQAPKWLQISAYHGGCEPTIWLVVSINRFVWKCWVNIPNEIAIENRDNDQQNHWVQWGTLFSDTPLNGLV